MHVCVCVCVWVASAPHDFAVWTSNSVLTLMNVPKKVHTIDYDNLRSIIYLLISFDYIVYFGHPLPHQSVNPSDWYRLVLYTTEDGSSPKLVLDLHPPLRVTAASAAPQPAALRGSDVPAVRLLRLQGGETGYCKLAASWCRGLGQSDGLQSLQGSKKCIVFRTSMDVIPIDSN